MQLVIHNLHKTYANGVKPLDNVHLDIGPGMFGLLGPNGAGKSTLMRTIATLQLPDRGRLHFGEIDILKNPLALRKVLAYLPQDFGVYPKTSVENLLDLLARLKGIWKKKERKKRIDQVLEMTNLSAVRKKYVSEYSGGMKQRFGIAQMLLHKPKLMIVDEPTAGLDPVERNRFLHLLRSIAQESTVIFSTHIVDDIQDLCTELAIMNLGKLSPIWKPQEAVKNLEGKIWEKQIHPKLRAQFQEKYRVLSESYDQENQYQIRVYAPHIPEEGFHPGKPSLEDHYFNYLSRSQ